MKKDVKKAHFIGICGIGMSAVAALLKDSGWSITGSDEGFYPPVSIYLEEKNLPCVTGYKKENIPDDVDLIVIGKNAKLVPETNEEVKHAYESGVEIKSFPQVLSELTKKTRNIICAGSHGKSTCTSLMAWCLMQANKNPNFFIGALPIGFESTSHIGDSETFIIEGDEYPSSNVDRTSKFLYYNPYDVLITSVEHDHVNIFKTQEDFIKPFVELIDMMPTDGILIVNSRDEQLKKMMKKVTRNYITYATDHSGEWKAEDIKYGQTTTFDLVHKGEKIINLKTTLLGLHNVENIVGVSAMLLERKLLTKEELKEGVRTFKGIVRRLDLKTEKSSVPIYEGFGSSYTKAKSAIDAIKVHFPNKRLIVIFEPHTFSWRNRDYIHHYDTIFEGVDKVYVYKPATQGSRTHEQLSQEEIVERIKSSGISTEYIKNEEEGLSKISTGVGQNDIVLMLTSGNLDGMVQSIPKLLEDKFGK